MNYLVSNNVSYNIIKYLKIHENKGVFGIRLLTIENTKKIAQIMKEVKQDFQIPPLSTHITYLTIPPYQPSNLHPPTLPVLLPLYNSLLCSLSSLLCITLSLPFSPLLLPVYNSLPYTPSSV